MTGSGDSLKKGGMQMDGSDKYIGRILDNRYEILELIGTGGMALVYKARCHRLNRMVAIKILKEDLADDEEFQRRFYTESQAVAMLSHPNIVAVYDVSRSGSTEYIVMELIEGITLKQYINRKGLLNWKESLHFATQITKALSHAHSRGIIHRDIKPHNIMILKDGSVKVADFGIARLLTVQNTLTQEALGSVHYISPEQAKGGHVDARSDIYSVGVVLYEMLTSRLPFVGDSAVSVAIQHISAIPLSPRDINPDIPAGLEDITMHAMEPDLNLRFTTAEEMLNDLEDFRKNPGIVFNYAASDPSERHIPDALNEQATMVISYSPSSSKPGVSVVKADGNAKPESALVKPERTAPAKRRAPVKPEMSSDEYRVTRKRAASTSTLVGIFAIVVFLIAVLVFMWNYLLRDLFNPQEKPSVTIPSFINRKYDDVIRDAEYEELFNFTRRDEYSDEYRAGIIISQNPTAERVQNAPLPGRKINVELVVSVGGEPPALMPDLVGRHFSEARNQLINLDLALDIVLEVVVNDSTSGYVVQTIPASGAEIARGNTVLIRYSGGPDIVEKLVPDMVGSTMAAVEAALRSEGFDPDFQYFPDPSEEGTVLFIARAGEMVAVPNTITVYVSSGPPVEERIVPDMVGSTMASVESVFRNLNIEPEFQFFEDASTEGTVLFIERAGDTIEVPATIIVYVSSGPPAPPDPTPEYPPETPYETPAETPGETPGDYPALPTETDDGSDSDPNIIP